MKYNPIEKNKYHNTMGTDKIITLSVEKNHQTCSG